ncbi:MAG: DUF5104 domain-containing protein [Oscillospiraceae bacterium]|nr:DUF5104 domain-containing protein [Oscillospiraceae bacterium]
MFKKLVCVIICAAMLCSLTGCGFLKFDSSKEREPIDPAVSPRSYISQMSQNIKDYLKKGDAENLHRLFGEYFGVTVTNIQGLLNFIDGEIVAINNDRIQSNDKEMRDGKYTYYGYGGRFTISLENGKEYVCHFAGYAVYDEKPEKVGLEKLYLINENDEKDRYGVGLYYNDKGQKLDYDGNVIERYLR